ncbi:hypothetical protein V493_04219 [Pseudogymnoascus sp. VKM F-4281 (FW-2241)]|nr:hypothetical protein V493_04219 [Pseudogymnoascus sp. VKM F-4281 (FW-2241)]
MPPRRHVTLALIAIVAFIAFSFLLSSGGQRDAAYDTSIAPSDNVLHGVATAPKLENATIKAELGNAAWKLLHTMMAKFPDEPTEEDSTSLRSFVYLFARLYPCGECARHFQLLLEKYPPQVRTRSSAATWACHVHNEVNTRLEKELFDCSKIGDFYDCGCGGDEDEKSAAAKTPKVELGKFTPLELEKDGGLTRGG